MYVSVYSMRERERERDPKQNHKCLLLQGPNISTIPQQNHQCSVVQAPKISHMDRTFQQFCDDAQWWRSLKGIQKLHHVGMFDRQQQLLRSNGWRILGFQPPKEI